MTNSPQVQITISYGYDIHSLVLSKTDFEKISAGETMDVIGQGFSIEGEITQDIWAFKNRRLHITCENGFDIFQGTVDDIINVTSI
jgi:hypothetical protein